MDTMFKKPNSEIDYAISTLDSLRNVCENNDYIKIDIMKKRVKTTIDIKTKPKKCEDFALTKQHFIVYDAICNLYLNGKQEFSVNEIIKLIKGTNNHKKEMTEEVCRIIKDLNNTQIRADIKNLLEKKLIKNKKILYDAGVLINEKQETCIICKDFINISEYWENERPGDININDENTKEQRQRKFVVEQYPPFLALAQSRNQIIEIPINALHIKTMGKLEEEIKHYVLDRIFNNVYNSTNILYSTIEKNIDSKIDKSHFVRIKNATKKIFSKLKEIGYIKEFKEYKDNRRSIGIEFSK